MKLYFKLDIPAISASAETVAFAREEGYGTVPALVDRIIKDLRKEPLAKLVFVAKELEDEYGRVVRHDYETRVIARWTDKEGNLVLGTPHGDTVTVQVIGD